MKLLFDTASGQIRKVVSDAAGAGELAEYPGYGGGMMVAETHYLSSVMGVWALTERPSVPEVQAIGTAPLVIALSTYSAGTTITARNTEGDVITITDLSQPLTLIDAGVYQIIISPPWPWLTLSQDVEVTNA